MFLHLFQKSKKASLSASELAGYLKIAQALGQITEETLRQMVAEKGWKELGL